MKFIYALPIAVFLIMPVIASAQEDDHSIITVSERSDGESEISIDRDALSTALAPLEQIRLEPPQLTTGENGEMQRWVYRGQVAPWDGVLLNPPAAAFIITEYEALYARALAALNRQRDSDMNRLHLEVGRLQLQIRSERESFRIRNEGQDRELDRLRTAHQALIDEQSNNWWENILYIGGGLLVGVAAGILIGFFAIN